MAVVMRIVIEWDDGSSAYAIALVAVVALSMTSISSCVWIYALLKRRDELHGEKARYVYENEKLRRMSVHSLDLDRPHPTATVDGVNILGAMQDIEETRRRQDEAESPSNESFRKPEVPLFCRDAVCDASSLVESSVMLSPTEAAKQGPLTWAPPPPSSRPPFRVLAHSVAASV